MTLFFDLSRERIGLQNDMNAYHWPRGAMVARLTPDQKVACSSHVGVIVFLHFCFLPAEVKLVY